MRDRTITLTKAEARLVALTMGHEAHTLSAADISDAVFAYFVG